MRRKPNLLCAFVAFSCSLLTLSSSLYAADVASAYEGLTYLQIQKRLIDHGRDAEAVAELPPGEVYAPIPKGVTALLGPGAIEYDSFVSTYLPGKAAEKARLAAVGNGLTVGVGPDRWIELPHFGFDPSVPGAHALAGGAVVEPKPIPGLLLAQFAYPLRDEWQEALESCGFTRIAYFQQRTLLLRGGGLDALAACGVASRIAWAEPWLASDRAAADLFEGTRPLGYVLQFLPGTDLGAKAERWPSAGLWNNARTSELGYPLAEIQTTPAALRQIVADEPDLLSVVARGSGEWSDERQGQIVAGNHDGASVTTPGYRAWLVARGLESPTHPQVVAIHDSGFDNKGEEEDVPHPDLEISTRFVSLKKQPPSLSDTGDLIGHGTMVAGIVAGNGAKTNELDPQGFAYGTGICPTCRVAATKFLHIDDLEDHEQAYADDLAVGAAIATNSWNLRQTVSGVERAVASYDDSAQFFDARVRDANSFIAGAQPMTIVFSAGNQAWDYATSTIFRDTVSTPATAKNVISVGASANYRPVSQGPPLACQENPNNTPPPTSTRCTSRGSARSAGADVRTDPSPAPRWLIRRGSSRIWSLPGCASFPPCRSILPRTRAR
ncbi:MAG: S8 family serine peptidase [Acidobacteriota bacterium]